MSRLGDMDRLLTGGVAIALAVALAVVLAFVGGSVNRPPRVVGIEAKPASVESGGSADLFVTADDPDGEALSYEYKAESGRVVVDRVHPHQARYSGPPEGAVIDRVTVTVTDARSLTSTASTVITVAPASAPAVALTPTPAPTLEPEAPTAAPSAPVSTRNPTPAPTDNTPPPPPTESPVPEPPANQAPTLQEGTTVAGLGDNTIVLVATGHDPEGDPLSFFWDFGACLQGENQSQNEAEVKLISECDYGVATLTWSDPSGGTATAQWTITR